MKKIQKGFTLIELMIVVAIIGILAAIALPAYQDYTIRAKMSEVITALSPAKTAVSEYYISNGQMPADATAAGVNTGAQGNYITAIVYTVNGTNQAKVVANIGPTLDNNAVVDGTSDMVGMAATGGADGVKWTCGPDNSNGVDTKYLPGSCRSTIGF